MASQDALIGVLEKGRDLGFLGPGPVEDHVVHAAGFLDALPSRPGRILDLGSGGGVPGLVLALLLESTHFTLLDSHKRRVAFLARSVAELGLEDRVDVTRARAEEAGHDAAMRESFDAVVARSFGPPSVTAECAAPLLSTGGVLIVSEPPEHENDRWPTEGLAKLGLGPAHITDSRPRFVVIRKQSPSPVAYARRTGVPARRPLF